MATPGLRAALRGLAIIGLVLGAPVSTLAATPLASTIVKGSSVYDAPALFGVYQHYLGQDVTAETAVSIAESVRGHYAADGYSRPGYAIEDDGVQSGIVRMTLREPNISAVRLSGDAGPYDARLNALFANLSSPRALRPEEIRAAVRRARRMPGLDVNVTTARDDAYPGAFVLQVDSDYDRVQGSVSLSNRGTEQIGRNLAFARLATNGLLGRENTAGVFLAAAESSTNYGSGGLYLTTALGEHGATARLQASATSLLIDSSGTEVDQNRQHVLLKLSRPFVTRAGRNLTAWGQFEIDNLDMLQDGALSREDRLRSIEAGLSAGWRDGATQQQATVELELGLDALGSRLTDASGSDAARDNDFTILRLNYVRLRRLGDRWTLRMDGYAQFSGHLLPSIKRFKLGGGRIGRGFEAAAVSGDRGMAAKFELRRSMTSEHAVFGRMALYAFYDIGTAWQDESSGGASAASAGLGTSVRRERVSGYLEIARPLTHADADGRRETGIFAELAVRF